MKLTKIERVRRAIPKPVKVALSPFVGLFVGKYRSELAYWKRRHSTEGGRFNNGHYRKLMLAMAGEADESFLEGKVVADFGCGPRGSLAWLADATTIGIDVLAPQYAENFPDDLRRHGMIYVASTEDVIPMPDNSVDVMFTINALDHAANLEAICSEIVRVLKPDGELIASFNLNEPATAAEPQTLTEELLEAVLLRHFETHSLRLSAFSNDYRDMTEGRQNYRKGGQGHMWFRGSRRSSSRQD